VAAPPWLPRARILAGLDMRTFTRLLGVAFLLAAALALGADLSGAGEGAGRGLMPLGALWYTLHPASLNLVQALIERYVWGPLWDPVLITVLQWPATPVFGVLGAVLLAVSFVHLPAREEKTAAGRTAEGDDGTAPRS
jgi:hypothetical protein